jgi:hypothetical protein
MPEKKLKNNLSFFSRVTANFSDNIFPTFQQLLLSVARLTVKF